MNKITIELTEDQARALVDAIENHCLKYEFPSMKADKENAFWKRIQAKLAKAKS